MSSVNVICAHCDNVYTMGNIHVCPPNPPETPALDALIADIEYAKNNSLLRDNSDPIFFKLAEALTEIRALLKNGVAK